MSTFSILRKADSSLVSDYPFPHIIVKNAIPDYLAHSLTSNFPIDLFDHDKNNTRFDYSAFDVTQDKSLASHWREFIDYHSSESFFKEVLEVFKNHISRDDYEKYRNMKSTKRGSEIHEEDKMYLDAQISINSPVTKTSSVRKIHVDNSNKLFSGLFYLRLPEDDSVGGNLELFKWKDGYSLRKKIKIYQEGLNPKFCNLVKEVEYGNNVGIVFLNSINSLHGVSERQKTNHPRCFVNLVGETKREIFRKHGFFKQKFYDMKTTIREIKESL